MATRTVEAVAYAGSPPTTVWELLADVNTWSEWGLFDESRLEQPGADDPNGVGARRVVKADRMRSVEEVYAFEPPHRLAYYVVEGSLPARRVRSEVQLTELEEGGTEIYWRTSFEAKWFGTGWMLAKNLKMVFMDAARRLAVRADTGAPAPDD